LKHNQKYIIPFKGLKDGKHIFSFKLDRAFFEIFEVEEINKVELISEIQLVKKNSYLELEFSIEGYIEVICDLCLDYYPQKINSKGKLYIRFGEEIAELSDELVVIPSTQTELDVSQYLYDFSMLGIPFKKQHPKGKDGKSGCDPEMVKILKNMEVREDDSQTDPRWNNLKNLKN
jgi:uncharacterized protein